MEQYSFPLMTLCPGKWMNVTRALEMGLSKNAVKLLLTYMNAPLKAENETAAQSELSAFMTANRLDSYIDLYRSLVLDEDSSLSCESCLPSSPRLVQAEFDMCYRIDINPDDVASELAYKTIIKIKFRFEDHSHGLSNKTYYAALNIHDDWSPVMVLKWIFVEKWSETFVSLKPTRLIRSSSESCIADDEVQVDAYSQSLCKSDCYERSYMLPCYGCMSFGFFMQQPDDPKDIPFCSIYSEKDCTLSEADIGKVCQRKCRPKCSHVSYDVMSTTVRFDVANSSTETILSLRLDVDNGMLTFEEITVYTIDSLVANLGGVLGLYLGGSVMTLVQLVFFIIGRWRKPFDGSTHQDDKVVVWRELQQELAALRAEMAVGRQEVVM
jgi:Amiloride-sensitive sodium channel